MKALSFEVAGRSTYGLLRDAAVREASADLRAQYPSLRAVLAADALASLPKHLDRAEHARDTIRFLPPIPDPDKIICVGVNYRPHVEEMGRKVPDHPLLFVRFPGSVVGHLEKLVKPAASSDYDFEGEFAIVIGKPARQVAREDALDVIAGYTCFMDGTVRDWQRHTSQFTPGKNFEASGALGPVLVTRDEVPEPGDLSLTTTVNGALMQEGRIGDLIFDIASLIEYCSTFTQLLPGDIIATGTPGGVGAARKPPIWLGVGDSVEVTVEGVGKLRNTVIGE